MKVLRKIFLVLGLVMVVGPANAAFMDGVNVGGGFMWSDSIRQRFESAGGLSLHVSTHITPPGPFVLAPFYDVSFSSPLMNLLGVSLLYTIGMRDFETHILFFGPSVGLVASDGESHRFIGGEVGYKFPMGESMGLFGRVKYVLDQHDVVDGMSGHIGVTFKLFQ